MRLIDQNQLFLSKYTLIKLLEMVNLSEHLKKDIPLSCLEH